MIYRNISRRTVSLFLALWLLAQLFVPSTAQPGLTGRGRKAQAQSQAPARVVQSNTTERAPRTYDIQHYTIRTRFDVPNRTVIGDETVSLKPLADDFSSFALDASDMAITSVTLAENGVQLNWSQPPDKLQISLDKSYGPDDLISVRILYRAKPHGGLFFINATQDANTGVRKPAQIWTQGQPEDNHHWFACYDYPDDKATTEQYITTGASQIAISNGALVETINNPDGTRTFHWVMEQPHSSYLTSLVVGDYVKLVGSYKNVPLEYYTYRGTEGVARRAFSETPEMMRWFAEVLGYEYPYRKYAQTIVSTLPFFSGMENITATTHADTDILLNTANAAQATRALVSHELSHSWFGNLVTCKSWKELWLNEGFATFMEASFVEHKEGRDAYMQIMRNTARTYLQDDTRRRRPLVYGRYRNPLELFDSTLYQKGGFVIHMLRETVGDKIFWKALNDYLNEYKYGTVETEDLKRVFERASGKRLDWFFDQWVYKAGYPELNVRYVYLPSSRQLLLDVQQTQRADENTPLVFQLPVEIEIGTAKGVRTEHLEVTQRTQRFKFQIDGKPLMIRFDKRLSIIKKVNFPQPSSMVAYQLRHSADALGREEAAEKLAEMQEGRHMSHRRVAAKRMRLNP